MSGKTSRVFQLMRMVVSITKVNYPGYVGLIESAHAEKFR